MFKKIAILSFVLFLLSSCTKEIKTEGESIITKTNFTVLLEGEELKKNEEAVKSDHGSLIKKSTTLRELTKRCKKEGDNIILYYSETAKKTKGKFSAQETYRPYINNTKFECDNYDGTWEMVKVERNVTFFVEDSMVTLYLKKDGSFAGNDDSLPFGLIGTWKKVDNVITFTSSADSSKVFKTTVLKGEGDDYFRLRYPGENEGLPATVTLSFRRK